jgi:hypothetical protein
VNIQRKLGTNIWESRISERTTDPFWLIRLRFSLLGRYEPRRPNSSSANRVPLGSSSRQPASPRSLASSMLALSSVLRGLVTPEDLPADLPGAVIGTAVLILLARPLAVLVCLVQFGFSLRKTAFASWTGVARGGSDLPQHHPRLGRSQRDQRLFASIFILVIASLIVQGWTVAPAVRLFGFSRAGPLHRCCVRVLEFLLASAGRILPGFAANPDIAPLRDYGWLGPRQNAGHSAHLLTRLPAPAATWPHRLLCRRNKLSVIGCRGNSQ